MMPVKEHAELISQAMVIGEITGMMKGMAELNNATESAFSENFEEIPNAYDEAIRFFLDKKILTKKEFEKLEQKARKYAFTMASTDSERLLELLKSDLAEKLESGDLNAQQWLDQADDIFKRAGMSSAGNYQLKTVFLTNIMTAINNGKMKIYEQADEEEFPLLEFVTVEDNRVRPEHARLDGFRAAKNDPVWQRIQPPLSYNCRCTIRPVHKDEGLEASKYLPNISGKGFEFVN
jgi:SPP1 gp7 family putative phage head morphogenesis protein